jgi:hypothetical protein
MKSIKLSAWNYYDKNTTEIGLFLLPIFTCFAYILISNHIWEDYLITFKFSRNLAWGDGLVYHPGERVHGFTSFFNTMIPALFDSIYRQENIYPTLWSYRVVCILVFASGCLLMGRTILDSGATKTTAYWMVALISLDTKIVAFTTNGQEIAFMVLSIAWALRLVQLGIKENWIKVGICAACFMYTRPDGFIYAALIFGGGALFERGRFFAHLISLVRSALVTLALFAPWLVFTWIYYGNPIPHTVTAKGGAYLLDGPMPISKNIEAFLTHWIGGIGDKFRPIYTDYLFEPFSVIVFGWLIGGIGISYWLFWTKDAAGKAASITFMVLTAYLTTLIFRIGMIFPWYMPAVCLLAYFSFTKAVMLVDQITSGKLKTIFHGAKILLLILAFSYYVGGTMQLTTHQRWVELDVRKAIGIWLKDNGKSSDTIHLEPIGYIGFYSKMKILDWPGLVSPEVVDSRHKFKNDRREVIKELEPDWLVLRPAEVFQVLNDPSIKSQYHVEKVFDNVSKLDQNLWIPGNSYHYFDAKFYVLKRIDKALYPDT